MNKSTPMPREREPVWILWGLVGIVLVVSLPLLTNYCLEADELYYQLLRIENLKEKLGNGQVFAGIMPGWTDGQRDTVAFLEGKVFLVIPALLRLLGMPVYAAYQLFLLLINIVTALISYKCFQKILCDSKITLFATALYMWMPYRINALYGVADVGEALAITFLPIVFYGLYLLLEEEKQEERDKAWIVMAVGYSLLLQSRWTSLVQVVMITVLLLAIKWKVIFCKTGILSLLKLGGALLVLNAGVLLPAAEVMLKDRAFVMLQGSQEIQYRGMYMVHYLVTFVTDGRVNYFDGIGFGDSMPLSFGFAVTCLILLYAWMAFVGKCREQWKKSRLWSWGRLLLLSGGIAFILSLRYFPWDALKMGSRIANIIFAGMLSPAEFVPIVSVCFVLFGSILLLHIKETEQPIYANGLLVALSVLAFVTTQFLVNDILRSRSPIRVYEGTELNAEQILSGAFLPLGTDEPVIAYAGYWNIAVILSVVGWIALCCYVILKYGKKHEKND